MKIFATAFAAVLLLTALCAAQDVPPASGEGSDQSVAAAARASRAQVSAAQTKQANIRRLLELTGAGSLATQAMDEMEKNIRPLITNSLPPGDYREKLVDLFFEKFRSKRDPQQLVELIVPIYDKYYTDEEINGLIQLYQTPLGKKMLTVLPKIMAESQAAGGKWGEELGRQSMMEVLEEHPEMQKAIEDAKKNAGP